MQTTGITHRAERIPEVIPFEDMRGVSAIDCFWERVAMRPPKKGEYYVSGAIPMAYKARADLSSAYLVVIPTHLARRVTSWEKGEPVPRPRPTGEDAQ